MPRPAQPICGGHGTAAAGGQWGDDALLHGFAERTEVLGPPVLVGFHINWGTDPRTGDGSESPRSGVHTTPSACSGVGGLKRAIERGCTSKGAAPVCVHGQLSSSLRSPARRTRRPRRSGLRQSASSLAAPVSGRVRVPSSLRFAAGCRALPSPRCRAQRRPLTSCTRPRLRRLSAAPFDNPRRRSRHRAPDATAGVQAATRLAQPSQRPGMGWVGCRGSPARISSTSS